MFQSSYFRTAFRGLVSAGGELKAKKYYMREVPNSLVTDGIDIIVSWV